MKSNRGGVRTALTAKRPDRVALLLAVAGFGALASVSALQTFLGQQTGSPAFPLWRAIGFSAATWVGWAILAPLIMGLGRRFDFAPGRGLRSLVMHLVFALICYILIGLLMLIVGRALWTGPPAPFRWQALFRDLLTASRLPFSMLTYAAILGLDRATRVWGALRERELQASRLEAQAARARLEALAVRLQPHFLFNSLHAVGVLIDEEPARARAMLAELGELLREVLQDSEAVEIPLREELRLTQRFLDIEQIRFADRLEVELTVAADTLEVLVPRLLLQPLLENALRHGLDKRAAAGAVRIAASSYNGRLRISVWNAGPPLAASVQEGIGLSSTRERLLTRYGPGATVTLRSAELGGVEAVVDIPLLGPPGIA